MKIAVREMKPDVREVAVADLPGGGLFGRGPRRLTLEPSQVALVGDGGTLTLHAVAGEVPREIELRRTARVVLLPRQMTLRFSLEDCPFANCPSGRATLWATVRIVVAPAPEARHPLTLDSQAVESRVKLRQALGECLGASLGAALRETVATVTYDPADPVAGLSHKLDTFQLDESRRAALAATGGLFLLGTLTVEDAACPALDDRHRGDAAAAQRLSAIRAQQQIVREQFRAKCEGELAEAQHANALGDLHVQARKLVLEERKLEIEADLRKDLAVQRRRKAEAEADAKAARVTLEEARTAVERAKAQLLHAAVDRQKAGAELSRAQARLAEAQAQAREAEAEFTKARAEAERKRAGAADELREALGRLEAKIGHFEILLEDLPKTLHVEVARPLELRVKWRAHSPRGILAPALPQYPIPRLRSGTWLDVEITVSHDAYLYILLRGSSGRWQCLVPEHLLPDPRCRLGIPRENRQKANRRVVWPGQCTRPRAMPFWMLDQTPGLERFLVVASLDRFDEIAGQLDREGLAGLRRTAAPVGARVVSRGVVPTDAFAPLTADPAQEVDVGQYHRIIESLKGDGRIMHHQVVEHAPATAHPSAR